MPWKSDAQRGWGHTAEGMNALGGPDKVKEWDAASKEKTHKKKKKKKFNPFKD